ncbi:hypothetical protein BABINDRAFT_159332 [Babjeviella inositovora NRRL Y-12698]|uniref:Uncharacterized protein n=1 Tax=Babjeviella inositovora NRRL Y-12698 TaxID=984486 RepID=A0A1E3R0D7_9ASCO|nr:uncharacterized protein BABINDRAFT_159332 [Babjeviella inositovora NRRL Y-12698]ODQ82832.1 hypothetical protein BABINDRAFT_159332 [Babjeviella inositovora NRRL Y-12698]
MTDHKGQIMKDNQLRCIQIQLRTSRCFIHRCFVEDLSTLTVQDREKYVTPRARACVRNVTCHVKL